MRRLTQPWSTLGVCLSFLGLLYCSGCSSPVGQASAQDVTNRAFTFADGTVFHPDLANKPTTLLFLDKATAFTLRSADGRENASGSNRFGSCNLTVISSTYALGSGPQENDLITLNPCDFDSESRTLTVSNRGITSTSASAIAQVVPATASDVQNRVFFFDSGEVFSVVLRDADTTLSFNGSATEFTLDSTTGSISGTATGGVQFSSPVNSPSPCVLDVRSSTYGSGGPEVGQPIMLSDCRFNSGTGTLIVSSETGSRESL